MNQDACRATVSEQAQVPCLNVRLCQSLACRVFSDFDLAIAWHRSDALAETPCDLALVQREAHVVELSFAHADSALHTLTIDLDRRSSVTVEQLSQVLFAPSFAPGLIGVDWDDVCLILASGSHAQLSAVDGSKVSDAAQWIERISHEQREHVTGILGVILGNTVQQLRAAPLLSNGLGQAFPDALRLVAAPTLANAQSLSAFVLVVTR